MIKLFGNPKREKVKKASKPRVEMKAAETNSSEKPRKNAKEEKKTPHELFWDGYSDIGYC